MSEDLKSSWIDAANARLALADKFFWFSLTLTVLAGGVAQVAQHASQREDMPRLTLAQPNETPRSFKIDRTPTASIKR
ncbi:MAG: hypothetical protein CTY15_02980 [Methylocystis sp.]|nr:MAG: hypothetical protein CTY15_02980 [Methylocystis sp.]